MQILLAVSYSLELLFERYLGGHTSFEKNPGSFGFVTLPLEILEKAKLHFWIFHIVVWHPLEILRRKTKTDGNSTWHDFFLITAGNSTSFLMDPWNFKMFFL